MLKKNVVFYLLFIALISLQLPFLHADPDAALTYSRDAATDEGIYSSQVRNYINNGVFSLSNVDCILKAMLFSVLLFISMGVFGTSMLVARLMVLSLSFFILFFACRNKRFRDTGLIFLLLAFTNYYGFQYVHFALSEMLSALCIFLGLFFLFKNTEETSRSNQKRNIFLSCLFIAFSYYLKVQFVYACVLPPAIFLAEWLLIKERNKSAILNDFIFGSMLTTLWGLLYYVGWYLPFKEIHQQLMAGQELTEIQVFSKTVIPVVKDNIRQIMFSDNNKLMSVLYIVSFLIGLYRFFASATYPFKMLFLAANLWVAVESHKWLMTYLPSRYLVSLYAAEYFVIAVVMGEILYTWKHKGFAVFAYVSMAAVLMFNGYKYVQAYNNREFVIMEANRYLSSYDLKDQVALGGWAGSFTWDCKMFSVPVWNHFLNYKEPLKTYMPRIIISEPNEDDSMQAYKDAGIDLAAVSDSSRTFTVRKQWKVIVYWIKADYWSK